MRDKERNTDTLPVSHDKETITPLVFNPEDYRHHLDGIELTEAQQNELLETLWQIMSTMVDIGWGVDSVQMMLPELFKNAGQDSEKLLASKDTPEVIQIQEGQDHE